MGRDRHKTPRIFVLVTAVGAGGIGFLFDRSEPPPPASAPVVQLETTDILVAAFDFGLDNKLSPQQLRWQTWPVVRAGASVIRWAASMWRTLDHHHDDDEQMK